MNNNKLAMNTNKQIHLTYRTEGLIVTVQCLQRLNIFVVMELAIATLFARMFVVRHQITCCRFLCFSIGLVAS